MSVHQHPTARKVPDSATQAFQQYLDKSKTPDTKSTAHAYIMGLSWATVKYANLLETFVSLSINATETQNELEAAAAFSILLDGMQNIRDSVETLADHIRNRLDRND